MTELGLILSQRKSSRLRRSKRRTLAVTIADLADAAQLSWELGTRAQAILSLNAPGFSVYSRTELPPPTSADTFGSGNATGLAPFFDIARTTVLSRNQANGGASGPQPLIQGDGSAGDPASIGFAVLLANWTGQDNGQIDYEGAANDQLSYLLLDVPKTSDGAISHRVSEVQLWSDFVYMVPPFLAYYGVMTSNLTLVQQAYNQIKLYRNYLRDPTANGLWKHILLGSFNDEGHWSTGNGWVAAGMLRVLATIKNSQYASLLESEQTDLAHWVIEIQNAMYSHLDSTYIFANYVDEPVSSPNFYDASSTALLASTVYRISSLWSYHRNLPIAERCRQTLFSSLSASGLNTSLSTSLANMNHFTPDGYLRPVVNPNSFRSQGNVSAEGQAFIIELQSAWRDWVLDGAKGADGSSGALSKGSAFSPRDSGTLSGGMASRATTWIGVALVTWLII
ncbi:hypothetical protein AX14_003490 [Amanita brunnescens Koide BX004]|nr:hypothetical protein AX14_003490 [Amanita brunnescens Koide BX004]